MSRETPDVHLTAEAVSRVLAPSAFVKNVLAFDSIDSTNAYAKILIGKGSTYPALVISEEQTQGKGRLGRRWYSEKGKNLTFSLVVESKVPENRIGALPLCVAESVARAVESCVPVSIRNKWPNDLLIGEKKVCGILMESMMIGRERVALVIGVGLNVNQKTFPPDLNATSLRLATGKPLYRLQLLSEIVNRLEWLGRTISDSDLDGRLHQWKQRCGIFGKMVRVQEGNSTQDGLAKGIAADGGLLIDADGAGQKILGGSVTVLEL